ncbi:MAG: ATP-dependent helicase [Desulfosarcinaceae bacterium]|nr:ATP-dependent helicase [Desulfosarcinaceae bacterium]
MPSKKYQIDYAKCLNPAQYEAVMFSEGPLLVIAGAGSGKTRTLTYRVARLVEDGIHPAAILLLSFTRKASQEMLRRAAALLDKRCEQVSGGTFHSFAHLMLRRYGHLLGFEQGFTIIDRADAETLVGMLRKEISTGLKSGTLPRKGTILNIISRSVNKAVAFDEVVYEDYPHLIHHLDALRRIQELYTQRKREMAFCDYDDLLVYLRQLLLMHEDLRRRLAARYEFVMVDEYQDTNPIQADIVALLGEEHRNVMVVGDDSQSIYSFRGADFQNIMRFPETFTGARVIKLEENYRSIQPILDLTNRMIDQAAEKYTKRLFTQKEGGATPALVSTEDENVQSRFVVEKIIDLNAEGVPLKEIAVLFRASFHSFDLEIELGREGVPFIKVGGFKFMEAAHIKDVLAHLRVIEAPHDRLSWYRILLLLERVGPKTAQRIFDAIMAARAGVNGICSLQLKGKRPAGLDRLQDLYATLIAAGESPASVAVLGQQVVDYYTPILRERFDDYPKREKDLDHLLGIMERYSDLTSFLADMALEPPNATVDESMAAEESTGDRLTLSTVHSAKGLEWHTVFIIWSLDGRFPSIHALNKESELEEELRLMYVAATRARERLYFTYPHQIFDRGSGMLLSRPSRFIEPFCASHLAQRHISW